MMDGHGGTCAFRRRVQESRNRACKGCLGKIQKSQAEMGIRDIFMLHECLLEPHLTLAKARQALSGRFFLLQDGVNHRSGPQDEQEPAVLG